MPPRIVPLTLAILALSAGGCAVTNQVHSELKYHQLATDTALLGEQGIGVLTPSAPTGQESDRQALGDALGGILDTDLTDSNIVPLPALLSAVNQAGLARTYADMFAEYEETGILEQEKLRKVGQAASVRYVAKLNLGDFEQTTAGRVKLAGIRFLDTRTATIRVHLEIWDSWTGAIVWQGNEELTFAAEGIRERPITFQQVATLASQRLVAKVGESGHELLDEEGPPLASAGTGVAPGGCAADGESDLVLAAVVDPALSELGC